jgi:hypothetical protein
MAFTGVWTVQQWSSLVSMLFVLISSIRLLRLARCLGVTVNNEGLRLVGGTFLNPAGFWPWDEIDSVAVVEEEYLRNAPRQVLLLTRAHGAIRLGPLPGRAAMVEEIQSHVRLENASEDAPEQLDRPGPLP